VVASASEALARTDDDAFDVITLLDVGTRRTVVFITATYGDSRYGRAFFDGTDFAVANVIDGDIGACAMEQRLEGTPCTTSGTCGDGFCLGVVTVDDVVLGEGRCVQTDDPASQPTRGTVCTSDTDCSRGEGLICMRLGDADGFCEEAWLRRRVAVEGAPIVGPSTTIPFVISGVATVSLKTTVSMVISHPNPADLTISIAHPGHPDSGSRAVLFHDPAATGPEVILRDVQAPLPSDESINGTWHLIIDDAGAGDPSAFAFNVELTIDSWFD
jgi:hypothetical protein